ncbi:MAG: NAD(P)/FAD-dependent oxidoreductase, partial [Planctomycetes bacterium]|nr:NAD(P)/FAD-dependent oxidoreductase [Planctomycetota bacterium]
MKTVILGNSAAAVAGALGVRASDTKCELTIISPEPCSAYSRPLITYYLAGKVSEEKMYYRSDDFYVTHGIKTLLGSGAARIDTQQRIVELENARTVDFDKLLIATGGAPFVPPIDDLSTVDYFTFTTWDDARKVKELIPDVHNAVVLGGGLIGLKVAEALNQLHVKTTIVELADRVLNPALDTRASSMMREALENTGIEVRTADTVVSVEGEGRQITRANLRSGEALPCDLLIVAVGVVPNVAPVAGSGIAVNRGILVDDHMRTNIEGIYAAGDVAEGTDTLMGSTRVIPIWPSAYQQGYTAGRNIAGTDMKFPGHFAMNSVEVGGTSLISVGLSTIEQGDYEILVSVDDRKNEYRKIVLKNDLIVGAIFVNAIDRAGIITGLIRDRINVKNFKDALADNDFGYISLPKRLRKSRLQTLGA